MKKLFLVALLLLVASPAAAQPQWEIFPFAGYLMGGEIRGAQGNLEVEDAGSFGLMVGIKLMEQTQLEFSYVRQETRADYKPLDGSESDLGFEMGNNYWHLGVNYAISQDKLTPFVTFGLGATHWSPQGEDNVSEWQFSAVLGGGAKYYFSDNFGIRLNLRIYSTFLTSTNDMFCSTETGCVPAVQSGTIMQFEPAAGIVLGF